MRTDGMTTTLVLLGPPGSFSDEAANKRVPPYASGFVKATSKKASAGKLSKHYVSSFKAIFKNLKPGVFALLPIKNKIIGDIAESVRLIKKYKPAEIFRFRMTIKFVIAAKNKIKLSDVRTIYCASIARAQCVKYVGKNLPLANFSMSFDSTSAAFTKIVQLKGIKAKESAGIGSLFGAKMYKLKILAKNIQDDKKDWTEFVVISKL